MKYFYNNHHLKTIPAHFAGIENLEDYIDDLEKKRLSETERQQLNAVLMRERMIEFINSISEDPKLKEHITKTEPRTAACVQTRSDRYYVIIFDNKKEVRCDINTYNAAPIKTTIKRLY